VFRAALESVLRHCLRHFESLSCMNQPDITLHWQTSYWCSHVEAVTGCWVRFCFCLCAHLHTDNVKLGQWAHYFRVVNRQRTQWHDSGLCDAVYTWRGSGYTWQLCWVALVGGFASYRALKSREISREYTSFTLTHQRSLVGVNRSRPLTFKDHCRSKAI